ncbi:hypothetical protein HGP14_30465 [Rhizobium sp. P32RR-XVIII]|uniref:hypothetical protein n=1 Tax=Rhizobium sp. P32RR-XVIII TaxID=2726738 RepID=UPI001456F2F6|nr:hypothetical protein [Rhizobium sp. P32RR-XVIII]NLS07592.1 hypothetical protein [Rhizobium sp. P32RR-XVIII]
MGGQQLDRRQPAELTQARADAMPVDLRIENSNENEIARRDNTYEQISPMSWSQQTLCAVESEVSDVKMRSCY